MKFNEIAKVGAEIPILTHQYTTWSQENGVS